MRFLSRIKLFITIFCVLSVSFSYAQKNDNVHQDIHKKLMADQVNIHKEVNLLDSMKLLYRLQEESKLFPAEDLYSSWNNEWVNPYRNMKVTIPDSLRIDVSDYIAPAMGKVTSNFGWRKRRMHNGIDIKVQIGDTIRSAFPGKVRVRKFERKGYGYYLVLRHPNGLETVYGHLSKFLVKENDIVEAGQPIALGGNTGRSTGSHLHFETRLLGMALNPNDIIDFQNYVAHTDTYLFRAKKAKAVASGSVGSNGVSAYHKVRSGDTLDKISRRYGTSVNQLCRLNNIKKTTILRIGQRLRYS